MDTVISRQTRLPWFGALALLVFLWTTPAVADVAGPPSTQYLIKADGDTVKIFLKDDYGAHGSPCARAEAESYSLVRQNVTTGEVHLLPMYCDKDTNNHEYIVDYCVPKGSYRYGLLTPLECGSAYHGTVTVSGAGTSCTDPRKLPSKKHAGAVPWEGKSNNIPCAEETGCSVVRSGGAQVGLGVLLLLLVAWRRRKEP